MGASYSSRKRAGERAESRRCPKCQRKSALKFEVNLDSVVSYCRWDDCDYESVTSTIRWEEES